jgi:N-acetylmuramoyl-L-alanine amidase CwlD
MVLILRESMPRLSNLLTGFTAATILMLAIVCAPLAGAQNAFVTNRVISCSIDGITNSLTFLTSSQSPLPAPVVQYLPGAGDQTVLVADFAGLWWSGESRVMRLDRSSGIEQVRIGLFQDNPPICRVSISSRNPLLFKTVSFKSFPGQVTVKWSTEAPKTALAGATDGLPKSAPKRPTYAPSLPSPLRVAQTRSSNSQRAHSTATTDNSAPVTAARSTPTEDDGYAEPLSLTPRAKLTPVVLGTPTLSPDIVKAQKAEAQAKKDIRAGKNLLNQKGKASLDSDDEKKTILSKLVSKTEKLFNSNDPDSHAQLTKTEPGNQQQTQPVAKIKKQDASSKKAMVDTRKVAIKTEFLPPSPQETMPVGNSDSQSAAASSLSSPAFSPLPLLPAASYPSKNASGDASSSADKQKPKGPPIEMHLSSDESSVVDNLKVELSAQHKINYKTFRMHNPERFVVDFNQLPELQTLAFSESESPLYYRFRAGQLPSNPNISRFVIDLPDAGVGVADIYDEPKNTLILLLTKEARVARVSEAPLPSQDNAASKPEDLNLLNRQEPAPDKGFNAPPPLGQIKAPGALTIVLDAGHGGTDPGAQRGEIQEKEITLAITQKLRTLLEKQGVEIIMTRSDDTFVSLEDRVKVTNQNIPDLFLSVHINALESTSDIHGIETYYQTDQSKPLADMIHQTLVTDLAAPDRGVRKARFYVINHTTVPAILAEVGFISNKDERQKLATSEYQQQIADALARGVGVFVAKLPGAHGDVAQNSTNLGASRTLDPQLKPLSEAGTTSAPVKSSDAKAPRSLSAAGRVGTR